MYGVIIRCVITVGGKCLSHLLRWDVEYLAILAIVQCKLTHLNINCSPIEKLSKFRQSEL